MRIPVIELEGYEADDLLATLAREAKEDGDDIVIVSGDRDVLQLVGDGVTVMMTRRGITDIARYDREAVFEKYGVTPAQWTDFVALKGETSDNLPGVPGIGDKTAAKLIQTYGDIEGVIEHAEELTPKIRSGVTEMAEQLHINKELGRLLDDVALDVGPEDIRLEPWDDQEVRNLFTSLEFRTLYERIKEYDLAPAADVRSGARGREDHAAGRERPTHRGGGRRVGLVLARPEHAGRLRVGGSARRGAVDAARDGSRTRRDRSSSTTRSRCTAAPSSPTAHWRASRPTR